MTKVYMVVELNEDYQGVIAACASLEKALIYAEDLAQYANLERGRFENYQYSWVGDDDEAVVYIDIQDVIE